MRPLRSRTAEVARHVGGAAAALLFLLPLWFLVSGSLRPLGLPPPLGVELLPPEPGLDAYRRLPLLLPVDVPPQLRRRRRGRGPRHGAVAALAGYGIRILDPRRRRVALIACLAVMAVPVTAVWATRFEVFRVAGIVDTLLPVMSTALMATNPFYVLVYAWSFTGIPDSQLQAARLEGASNWRIWRAVALPQARGATLAVAVLAFTFHWGNFIDGLLYLTSQSRLTLPVGLRTLQLLNPTDFPLLLAGSTLLAVPSVLVFLLAQRVLLDDPLRGTRTRRHAAPAGEAA